MTVYVDDAVTLWRGRRWAHLMADTLDELHAFAERLGLPRRAFQNKTSGAHYDVTADMRLQAIALGAMPISRHRDRELVRAVIANARAQGRGGQSRSTGPPCSGGVYFAGRPAGSFNGQQAFSHASCTGGCPDSAPLPHGKEAAP